MSALHLHVHGTGKSPNGGDDACTPFLFAWKKKYFFRVGKKLGVFCRVKKRHRLPPCRRQNPIHITQNNFNYIVNKKKTSHADLDKKNLFNILSHRPTFYISTCHMCHANISTTHSSFYIFVKPRCFHQIHYARTTRA